MRYSLVINGYEFGRYIPENGVAVSRVPRNEKSVVTMDGVRHSKRIEKRHFDVTLYDMPDSIFVYLRTKLSPNPATVHFTDFDENRAIDSTFYVDDFKYSVKQSIGDASRLSGVTLSLEEK